MTNNINNNDPKFQRPLDIGVHLSCVRVHIDPHFGATPIAEVSAEDVEEFVEACLESGLSVKSTVNYLGFLHGIFAFAVRKRWAHRNRCDEIEKPAQRGEDPEIRFLDQAELDALLDAIPVDRSRHKPATVERAARVRELRDVDGLSWKQIAAELGCAESTAIYLHRCDPELRARRVRHAQVEALDQVGPTRRPRPHRA
jgi:hypothetical protein